ncbi:MAG: GNAT family N-acetyltransferase [Saprospiraceae bacterium]|jgi:ribosomal-protein-alanine N-acetyltransferase|nr:GNAT family N-acetyltransferase [Saprospiraceae bacterium]
MEDRKCKLRPWQQSDIESLVKYANNYKITSKLTNKFKYPYTRQNGEQFINMAVSMNPQQIFAIDLDGEAIGSIGIHPQDDIFCRNAELGYWLAEEFWGKGIATEAVKQIVKYGFETFDIDRIFARPFGSNVASQKLLEKSGFTLEAQFAKTIIKNGTYEDELVYGIRQLKD